MNEVLTDIAVIIPCFNDGNYLQEALSSLFTQTFRNWEAVVIDDGSTDPQTIDFLEKINHSQVKIHRHTKNRGLAAARNSGIRLTKAPIIFPLDADDHFVPESLEVVVRSFEKSPEVDVFYPDIIHFGAEDRIRRNPEFDLHALIRRPFIQAQSPFRR